MNKSAAYSFCESVGASGRSPWHIRRLTEAGQKFGGGIDTPMLCRDKRVSGWDLRGEVTPATVARDFTCRLCQQAYARETK